MRLDLSTASPTIRVTSSLAIEPFKTFWAEHEFALRVRAVEARGAVRRYARAPARSVARSASPMAAFSVTASRTPRNASCPCGSGKFKRCCLDAHVPRAPRLPARAERSQAAHHDQRARCTAGTPTRSMASARPLAGTLPRRRASRGCSRFVDAALSSLRTIVRVPCHPRLRARLYLGRLSADPHDSWRGATKR